jgi:hypothetical protein
MKTEKFIKSPFFPNIKLKCYVCGETLVKDSAIYWPSNTWGDWTHYYRGKAYRIGCFERPIICTKCYKTIKEEQ